MPAGPKQSHSLLAMRERLQLLPLLLLLLVRPPRRPREAVPCDCAAATAGTATTDARAEQRAERHRQKERLLSMKPDDENYTDARDQQRIEEAIRTMGSHRLKTDETYAVDSMCVA